MKKRPKDMSPQEIRVELLRSGVSQAEIARALGKSRTLINRVIDGTSVSDLVRKSIATAINKDVETIWPSTYIYGGPRKQGRPFCGPKDCCKAA